MLFNMLWKEIEVSSGVRRTTRIPYLVELSANEPAAPYDVHGNPLTWESWISYQADITLPRWYDGLARVGIETGERINTTHWKIFLIYEYRDSSYTFDFTGGTTHIKSAIAHVASYGLPGKPIPDFNGLIGVDDEGNINGVDIDAPRAEFTETHFFTDNQITQEYKNLLMDMSPSVNSDEFRGREPGEVKFLGALGNKRDNDLWEIQYRFAVSPNRRAFLVGDILVAGEDDPVKGWDYLWFRSMPHEQEKDGKKFIIMKVTDVHVEQVYNYRPMSALGLDP